MATAPGPLTPINARWTDQDGSPSKSFREYMPTLDTAVRFLIGLISSPAASPPLIAVAVPTNANAATAGVGVGQFYRDTADPCKVYIRTV